jgi:2-polyprenyl-6-methoxyphenol hydroxylase-like FAD-dependent oxidoreductase
MPDAALSTTCCIAGGGPAGLMLGLLLARAGVEVIVLEKHADFFRDFRGDTIHPSTLDLIDQLGLREKFDAIPHTSVRSLDVVINGNRLTPVDFSHLPGPNRAITLMPQWDFLTLLAEEAARYPTFRLLMGAEVTGLIRRGDQVTGVRATVTDAAAPARDIEIAARLIIAADGRDSVVRRASGLVQRDYGVPIDVLWFRMPRPPVTPRDTLGYINSEAMLVTIPREDYFQCGLLIEKGTYPAVQTAGIPAFRDRIRAVAPFLDQAVRSLASWDEVRLLTVQINRLDRWWQPGLLCIGDAAHAMSPAFGVGVNYAIQDAVAAANLLVEPLRSGPLTTDDLAGVQSRRLPPVRRMQALQRRAHGIIGRPGAGELLPDPMREWQRLTALLVLPLIRRLAARIVGRGFRPERIGPQLDPDP